MQQDSTILFHYIHITNKMQRYTVYFIWKLLYMFRVVPPPKIRSAYNCIYSIWYLSHCYCYLSLSWKSWNCCGWRTPPTAVPTQTSSNSSTIGAGSNNGVTDTRCCRYSCLRSWWWVVVPPEICRAVSRWNKLCNVVSCWIYIGIFLRRWDPRMLNYTIPVPMETTMYGCSLLKCDAVYIAIIHRCFPEKSVNFYKPRGITFQKTGAFITKF
jgi:hypothetical protein